MGAAAEGKAVLLVDESSDISDWISNWARVFPEKAAIRHDAGIISYGDLAARVCSLATLLHHEYGVGPGDRVAFLGFNSPALLELLFGCSRLGAMLVPLNWRLTAAELSSIVGDADPLVLFSEAAFQDVAEVIHRDFPQVQRATCGNVAEADWACPPGFERRMQTQQAPRCGGANRPVLICYTSGTTGKPKGAMLSQRALAWNAINSIDMHDLTSADRVLTTTPMFHVGGLNIQTLPALGVGATVTLHRKFDADAFFDTVEAEATTLVQLVPTQWNMLMANQRWETARLDSLRMAVTGSTLVPEALMRKLQARGLDVIQIYGSTETAPIAAYSRTSDARDVPTSTGRPALHCSLRIVDEEGCDLSPGQSGEILVHGENLMDGYWRDPETTRLVLLDGWFHTGDIGHFDADGNLFIDDRKKDIIISGGENISSSYLEALLYECPDVAEAAVIGRPDPHWGEAVVAVVVRQPGSNISADDVLALFAGRVAKYKVPREVLFVDALPRTAIGKVLKAQIREMLAISVASAQVASE